MRRFILCGSVIVLICGVTSLGQDKGQRAEGISVQEVGNEALDAAVRRYFESHQHILNQTFDGVPTSQLPQHTPAINDILPGYRRPRPEGLSATDDAVGDALRTVREWERLTQGLVPGFQEPRKDRDFNPRIAEPPAPDPCSSTIAALQHTIKLKNAAIASLQKELADCRKGPKQ